MMEHERESRGATMFISFLFDQKGRPCRRFQEPRYVEFLRNTADTYQRVI